MPENYGTPLDTPPIPPLPAAATDTPFVPVTLDLRSAPPNLPAGVMPLGVNFLVTAEGLAPRSGVTVLGPSGKSSANSWFNNAMVNGLFEYFTSGITQTKTLVAISGTTLIWHTGSHWTAASWSSSGTTLSNFQAPLARVPFVGAVIYEPVAGENAVVFSQPVGGLSSPWIFPGPQVNGAVYSTLTNAPLNPCAVTYFDTRVVFANMISSGTRIGQRVAWSARGDPQTYTAPDGGAEDLVAMRGQITYLTDDGDRLIVLSEREIWAGYRADFPYGISFAPLDRTVGCPYPYSVAQTPNGLMFMGQDMNVYSLPKGSSQAVAIGTPIWPQIRRDAIQAISNPALVGLLASTQQPFDNLTFGVYDNWRGAYQLYVMGPGDDAPNSGVSGPRQGYSYAMLEGVWSRVSVPANLSCGVSMSAVSAYPGSYFGTSNGSVVGQPSLESSSIATQDFGSAFSASALFPIGNPNPAMKLFLRDILIDYSNASAPSGSSLTIALSADFGQTYDRQIGVALPHTLYSRQTVVNIGYAATYPSVEVRYESQVSGDKLRLRRMTALVGVVGQPGVGG